MSRPFREFDRKTFEGLCRIQCTEEEICDVLETTDKTLDAWCKREYGERYSEVYKKKSAVGKMSLRRMQWKHAEKSAVMAIFLGKQYLGQSDNPENSVDMEDSDSYFKEAGM